MHSKEQEIEFWLDFDDPFIVDSLSIKHSKGTFNKAEAILKFWMIKK